MSFSSREPAELRIISISPSMSGTVSPRSRQTRIALWSGDSNKRVQRRPVPGRARAPIDVRDGGRIETWPSNQDAASKRRYCRFKCNSAISVSMRLFS